MNALHYVIRYTEETTYTLDKVCQEAKEELNRLEEIEKIAREFVLAKRSGANFMSRYKRLAHILEIDL